MKNSSPRMKSINKDLQSILDEADKITIDDLEFDKLFKEQAKILCDIKTLLEKDNQQSQRETLQKCNLTSSTSNNDSEFKQLLSTFKKKYSSNPKITKTDTGALTKETKKIIKHHKRQSSKRHSSKRHSSKRQSSKRHSNKIMYSQTNIKTNGKSTKKSVGNVNNNYPIILLKDKKPYKNVIMIKN